MARQGGRAEIQLSENIAPVNVANTRKYHRLEGDELPYKQTYALHLHSVTRLTSPVQFVRLKGSIGWAKVRLTATDIPTAAGQRRASTCVSEDVVSGPCNIEGLTYIGNACFIKSVLQALFRSPAAASVFNAHKGAGCGSASLVCLLRNTDTARRAQAASTEVRLAALSRRSWLCRVRFCAVLRTSAARKARWVQGKARGIGVGD